jgi:SAM-dependent methyltransferase
MTSDQLFRRVDESDDLNFYVQPRLVVHIDEAAVAATTALFGEYLPAGADVLDLMSSWRSHLPTDVAYGRVAGLGLNAEEMRRNPQLSDYVVQSLNANPTLPYADASFDAAVCTVSVQYLTQPLAVFRELARVLRPGAPALIVFSNRMFPTKAVAVWQSLDDAGHCQLVEQYFRQVGGFEDITTLDRSPGRRSDPLFAVVGKRVGSVAAEILA